MPSFISNIWSWSNVIFALPTQRIRKVHWILVISDGGLASALLGQCHVCYPNHIQTFVAMPTSKRYVTTKCRHFIGASNQTITNLTRPICFNTHEDPGYTFISVSQQLKIRWRTVVLLSISCQYTRTWTALFHTNQHTHCCSYNTCPPCKYLVHNSNIFCISTTKPSNKELIVFIRVSYNLSLPTLLTLRFPTFHYPTL